MNKLTKITAILTAILFLQSPASFAVTQQVANMSASVDQQLTLDMGIKADDPNTQLPTGPLLTAMDYGTLVRSNNATTGAPNALRGDHAFHVFLGTNASSRKYKVAANVTAMAGSAGTLPHAMLRKGIQVTDGATTNAQPITGGTFDTAMRDAVGTYDVYTSNPGGQGGVIEMVYGISGGNADGSAPFTGWVPIPPGQASGAYSGTATFTITLV